MWNFMGEIKIILQTFHLHKHHSLGIKVAATWSCSFGRTWIMWRIWWTWHYRILHIYILYIHNINIFYTNPKNNSAWKMKIATSSSCNTEESHTYCIIQYCDTPVRTPVCIWYMKKCKEKSCVSMSSWTRVVSSHLVCLCFMFFLTQSWLLRDTKTKNRKQIIPI